MTQIEHIWIDNDTICARDIDGQTYKQSLLWYPKLLEASQADRNTYEFGMDGIHWRALDTDISFESFLYPDAMPSKLQRFFLTHPEINIAAFAKRIGINSSQLRKYINGLTQPPQNCEDQIITGLKQLGIELTQF